MADQWQRGGPIERAGEHPAQEAVRELELAAVDLHRLARFRRRERLRLAGAGGVRVGQVVGQGISVRVPQLGHSVGQSDQIES